MVHARSAPWSRVEPEERDGILLATVLVIFNPPAGAAVLVTVAARLALVRALEAET